MARIEFRRDRQFLPAAIEVLETPSSPTRRALLMTLCAFVVAATAWSFIGRIDIEAIAKGNIQPQGREKVIEPLESGRVLGVLVEDGSAVRKGDALVVLDPVDARADERAAVQALSVDVADAARYRAAASVAASDVAAGHRPAIAWDPLVPDDMRTREGQALAGDLTQLANDLRNLDMQKAEKSATIARLDRSVAQDVKLIATLQQRVDMREVLASHGNGTKADYLDALQDLQRTEASLVSDRGQRGEALASLDTIESDKVKLASQFRADATNKVEDASNKAALDQEAAAKAHARMDRTTLFAPVDGIVQKLAVTSIGQVVTTGQELMTIVPYGGTLNVAAFIDNIDIGFVRAGQEVAIKLDAFPFTRYGTLKGKVLSVATDAIDEGEARRMQANATSLVNSSMMQDSSGSQEQKFVFPIVISLDSTTFTIGDRTIPLSAGMSVTADIKTDSQRIIDYVISPLNQTVSESLHER